MKYIPQLDGIRAIAVILVIISHWTPKHWMLSKITGVINGVDIFFVLSGFLITGILLINREKAEKMDGNSTVMKSFFVRRALRIFPIYYLALAFIYIIGDYGNTDIRNNYLYFFTYTSNFYFFNNQSWNGMLSPLWSLSVEEQFYLVWPWLMIYCKKRHQLPIILIFIAIGILFQIIFWNNYFGSILTFSCFDAFGIGALLAYIQINKPSVLMDKYKFFLFLGIISMLLISYQYYTQYYFMTPRTLTSVFILWIMIEIILKGSRKSFWPNVVLNNSLLIFMGKISYSLYLFHMIIPYFTGPLLTKLNSFLPASIYIHNSNLIHIENFIILIGVSYLSYIYIEMPFLSLKKKFEYQGNRNKKKVMSI
jgi:peptidoglycan/LPS O-acetylase OafA/YrhL